MNTPKERKKTRRNKYNSHVFFVDLIKKKKTCINSLYIAAKSATKMLSQTMTSKNGPTVVTKDVGSVHMPIHS